MNTTTTREQVNQRPSHTAGVVALWVFLTLCVVGTVGMACVVTTQQMHDRVGPSASTQAKR